MNRNDQLKFEIQIPVILLTLIFQIHVTLKFLHLLLHGAFTENNTLYYTVVNGNISSI